LSFFFGAALSAATQEKDKKIDDKNRLVLPFLSVGRPFQAVFSGVF
jgi:hypothetical protein